MNWQAHSPARSAALLLAVHLSACGSPKDQHGALDAGPSGTPLSPDGGQHDGAVSSPGQTDAGGPAAKSDGSISPPAIGPVIAPGDPGAADVSIEVHADGELHAISPLIYGTNNLPLDDTRQTIQRLGGNRWTAWNWENNASNAGSDYQFENDGMLSQSNDPAKPVLDAIADSTSHGAATLVTVPIVDWVAGDKSGPLDPNNPPSSYFPSRLKKNVAAKGSAFVSAPDASDDSVYQDEFVALVKGRAGSAKVLFSLDNEPDLWNSTHKEVHPDQVTYAELWERNQRFASAIKAVWPAAEVTGFVSYGYNGYVNLQNAPDGNGRNFIEWYLDQAKAAETAQGKRLIDYLDLHWYPEVQVNGVRIDADNDDPATVAAREQAPRSLWDASYVEASWIPGALLMGGPIKLLPWLKDKIDKHYPGTKLAISEWNYGGGDHISGAITAADVLGIFGRDGVDLATMWPMQSTEPFISAAFHAYRNYDGNGGSFGDISVPATTSDVQNVTVYASLEAAKPERVVIIAINKASTDKSVALQLSHSSRFATAATYRVQGASARVVPGSDVPAAADNAWQLSLPAQSVTVIVPQLAP